VGPHIHKCERGRGVGGPIFKTGHDEEGFCGITDPTAIVICVGRDLRVSWYGERG
jgi:hypothetical protein